METELKHSLLLTHGTIYGYVADSLPYVDYTGKSTSVVKFADQAEWRAALYPVIPASPVLDGSMTNNAPIDFHHWTMAGYVGESGLEWWQQCMTLFMRHI